MSQPVYRRPRSHAYRCRCSRCLQSMPSARNGDLGIIGPLVFFGLIAAVAGFWPAMVWHGYTDGGGWRWDIHSTIAELAYFGIIAFVCFLGWLGKRPARPAVTPASIPEALKIADTLEAEPPAAACSRTDGSGPGSIVRHAHGPDEPCSADCDYRSTGAPACRHLNAEPLVNRFALSPAGWYCPECDEGLPREFGDLMRWCCGTPPGTPHVYNCACRREVIL